MAHWMVISEHADLEEGHICVEFFEDLGRLRGYLEMLSEFFNCRTEIYERVASPRDGSMEYRRRYLTEVMLNGQI